LSKSCTNRPKCFQCVKVTLLASINGYAPAIAVEFGRKVLFSTDVLPSASWKNTVKARKIALRFFR